ncbi:Os01g0635000, partial [Oryza sativa Japonica Group]
SPVSRRDMASSSKASSSSSASAASSEWTKQQNKQFERALAVYDTDAPDRWHNVARYMGGAKSAEEVRRHYERLQADVEQIEAGGVPFSLGYGATPQAGRR